MQEFYFSGTIERVIFENASNFFRILLLEIDETDSDFEDYEIIVTGTMGDVMEGEDYTFWGQLTNHPKYGEQLQMTRYERSKPSASGLIKYFASDNFKGIGKKTAERIVEIYGEDPIDKILEDPSKLEQIPNLSKVNREAFVAKLKINYGTEQILSKLSSYGLTPKAASQIFNQYKEESLNLIEEHPYLLVEEVQGIGFKIADQLAERLGIASDAPERLRAALIHCLLETSMEEGDTYIEAKALLERTIILLESARQIELDPALVAKELTNLIQEDKVQNVETKIFDNTLYFAEQGIYTHLTRIMKDQPDISAEDKIQASLEEVEEELGITYDKVQKDAIIKALQSKVFILTGGPGTGKTTVINGIIKTYADLHGLDLKKSDLPIILAAPTGRAARRMNELTQLPSATIHRHLGLNSEDDFKTLEDYLDCDLIIIDEFSMVDTWLANQLFESISDSTQVIIVGDQDQLPSVGPGQVLADLLQIDDLPKVSLTKIFRQSEDSTIVTLASQMRQGQLPADFTEKKADRSYFEANANHIPQMVPKIVSAAIKSGIAAQDVQILAPMYRGQAGINNLNTIMQDLLNPQEKANQFAFNDIFFRKNDNLLHFVKPVFDRRVFLKTCTNGSSELMTNLSMSLVNALYNLQLMKIAGENGVAAYGAVMYVNFIFVATFLGYAIGCAPVISYHYGAGNHAELKNLYKKSMSIILVWGVILFGAAQLLAPVLSKIFVGYNTGLYAMTLHGFRVYAIAFLIIGINIFGSSFFTALNNGLISAVISFLRTLVFQVIMVLTLPLWFGINGIWSAISIAEALTLIMTTTFFVRQKDKYHYL